MSLIDLYVSEVGRNLPAKNREDIEKEIRSSIEDTLEDRSMQQDRPVDEEMTVDVLKELGHPEDVARSYQPPRYLIGPQYFPTFLLVVRIVLTVVLIINAIGIGVALGRAQSEITAFTAVFAEGIQGLFTSIITALGNIVLIFAILQWLVPEPKKSPREWDPRKMRAEPDPEQVKPIESLLAVIMSIAALFVLNFYPQWLGISTYMNGNWLHAPVLTSAFFQYLPGINLLLVAGLIQHAYLLQKGRWSNGLRWFSIAVSIGTIILAAMMLNGPDLLQFNFAELMQSGWDANAARTFEQMNLLFNTMFRIALGISLVMQVVEIVKTLIKIFGRRLPLPAGMPR